MCKLVSHSVLLSALLSLLLSTTYVRSQENSFPLDYALEGGEISVNDELSGSFDIATLFTDQKFAVEVSLSWSKLDTAVSSSNVLKWVTSVDGVEVDSGEETLNSRALPDSISAGTGVVTKKGMHNISVEIRLDDSTTKTSREYRAYNPGVAIIPLVIIVVLAIWLQMVELSLGFGVFIGACLVTGSIADAFKNTLAVYLVGAVADKGHAYVYIFTVYLAGLVALMEKSGGLQGFADVVAKRAKTPRSGQIFAFIAGLVIFFDDYANTLVVGCTFRPIMVGLSVSVEKLAFLVDATAAPIASIVPISSWIGFEIGLIQTEIDKIVAANDGVAPEGLTTSGMAVFLETIQYRYYPIFMLFFIPLLIFTGRDFASMLIAERKTQVYGRKDGGDGSDHLADDLNSATSPREDTPPRWYNMAIPVLLIIFYIFYLLIMSGNDGSGTQSFSDMIQNADSYQALLFGIMAAALTSCLLYFIQFVHKGGIMLLFSPKVMTHFWTSRCGTRNHDNDENGFRILMNLHEALETFNVGGGRIFDALVVLTLAWAVGHVMVDVGADRLFALFILEGNLDPTMLPTLSFIISALMALCTGTSWGTMTIMFPLICSPTWYASGGDDVIFYATIAGILSGAIMGDHASPISDTTVLSSLASKCKLMAHVATQAPYAATIGLFSILVGTIPIGRRAYPNGVAIFLGFVSMVAVTFGIAVKTINKTGRFDIFTELYLKCNRDSYLHQLKEDTATVFETGEPVLEKLNKEDKDEKLEVIATEMFDDSSKDTPENIAQDEVKEHAQVSGVIENLA